MPFHPSQACKVVIPLDLNRKTGEKRILPGSIWEHTQGVCSTVESAPQVAIKSDATFQALLRAHMNTPIKELMEQIPFPCNVNEVTRARQHFKKQEVSV